jgi:hypothetical protein
MLASTTKTKSGKRLWIFEPKDDDIMAFFSHALSPTDTTLTRDAVAPRPSFFSRLLAGMIESRQRQADREIAQFLRRNGGKFTDSAEREIERRFLPGAWKA